MRRSCSRDQLHRNSRIGWTLDRGGFSFPFVDDLFDGGAGRVAFPFANVVTGVDFSSSTPWDPIAAVGSGALPPTAIGFDGVNLVMATDQESRFANGN